MGETKALELRWDWNFWARAEQLAPDGDWLTWLYLGGRGAGKTRAGSEWVRSQIKAGRGFGALVAATAADARDTMVEGDSGIMSVCWENDRAEDGTYLGRPQYEPSRRRVTWNNGAVVTLFSAEEPDRLRGPNRDFAWADELAAWKRLRETWDMLQMVLRLGENPQQMVTTTPRPDQILIDILNDSETVVSRGSTKSNSSNLSPSFLKTMERKYAGTTLGRQELEGEILTEVKGALWTRSMLDGARGPNPEDFDRIVVAVDPPATSGEDASDCGIVVAGKIGDEAYVLADHTVHGTPLTWARAAIAAYWEFDADRLVAEVNQGGEMVQTIIHQEDSRVAYKAVRASKGKRTRAEPVAALYEQGRVTHCDKFLELEDQLTTWVPGKDSPDRLDALVWAITELILEGDEPFSGHLFDIAWLQEYDKLPITLDYGVVRICPSNRDKGSGHTAAMLFAGDRDTDQVVYALDAVKGSWSLPQIAVNCAEFVDHHARLATQGYRVYKIEIEDSDLSASLKGLLEIQLKSAFKNTNIEIPVEIVEVSGSRVERAELAIKPFMEGRLSIPATETKYSDAEWVDWFREEYTGFSQSGVMDCSGLNCAIGHLLDQYGKRRLFSGIPLAS